MCFLKKKRKEKLCGTSRIPMNFFFFLFFLFLGNECEMKVNSPIYILLELEFGIFNSSKIPIILVVTTWKWNMLMFLVQKVPTKTNTKFNKQGGG